VVGFVSVSSTGEVLIALAANRWAELSGTAESDSLDFKRSPYSMSQQDPGKAERQKWELAKDVAALANAQGGLMVIGVGTQRQQHEIADLVSEIKPFSRALVDPVQYQDATRNGVPRPSGRAVPLVSTRSDHQSHLRHRGPSSA